VSMSSARLRSAHAPRCIVIAGPNGAGKTTFAREFLPREGGVIHFVVPALLRASAHPFDLNWQRDAGAGLS